MLSDLRVSFHHLVTCAYMENKRPNVVSTGPKREAYKGVRDCVGVMRCDEDVLEATFCVTGSFVWVSQGLRCDHNNKGGRPGIAKSLTFRVGQPLDFQRVKLSM